MGIETVFWLTAGAVTLCWLSRLVRGDFLNWLTFMVLGIDLPLVLFLQGWSTWIYGPVSFNFYLVFVLLHLVLLGTFVVEHFPGTRTYALDYSPFKLALRRGTIPIGLLNLAIAAAYIVENRICTGEWFPAAQGIQEHVFHASGFVYVTNSQYFVLVVDVLAYFISHKRRYVGYAAALVLMPMITRASRMDSAIEVVGLAAFVGYYLACQAPSRDRRLSRRLPALTLAAVAAFGLIAFMVDTGTNRMNHFGRYDYLYSDYIGYTGPSVLGEVGAWYYGYFPMSFNNLNYNIALNSPATGNWFGLNSFRALHYGIFHISWFGVPTDIANSSKIVLNSASAVATGFWDFWFDYGVFCFVPMVVSAALYLFMKRRLCRPNKSIALAAVFFYWISLWAFMSFQNTAYFDMVFNNMILTCLALWYYFVPADRPQRPRSRARQLSRTPMRAATR